MKLQVHVHVHTRLIIQYVNKVYFNTVRCSPILSDYCLLQKYSDKSVNTCMTLIHVHYYTLYMYMYVYTGLHCVHTLYKPIQPVKPNSAYSL